MMKTRSSALIRTAFVVLGLALAAPTPSPAQDAWLSETVPSSSTALFDLGSFASTNISASIASGTYFVTDLGTAPSGTFRRIRNAGSNAIPFVMNGSKIIGYAPNSPIGGPGGSGNSNVLPVAPNEVVEFVSLGSDSWQLVQYLPLGIQNFGLQAGYATAGIPPTNNPPDNWFQLGPIAGTGPQPDFPFAVNWTLHGGKLHTHGAYFMLPGDTPNIELRQADISSTDQSPIPWMSAPYLGAHISGRALVDIGSGVYDFLNNTQVGTKGYNHSPSFLYQGFTASIAFPIVQPPTKNGDGGALVFKITPNDTITPFQRGWFSNAGNLVVIGKAAFEACGLNHAYPYNYSGNIWQADSPCNDADYSGTQGSGNLTIIATDVTSTDLGKNAAISIRKYGAHGEGLDTGYDPSGNGTINRYGIHGGMPTLVEGFDPTNNVFTYPTKPAFQADLTANLTNVTGDGTSYAVPFNTVSFNQGNNFNTSTGIFTAPVTGLYQLQLTIQLSGVSTSNNRFALILSTTGNNYLFDAGKLQPDSNTRVDVHFSVLAKMNAGETARGYIQVEGGSKSVSILWGGAGIPQTTFSGFLVG